MGECGGGPVPDSGQHRPGQPLGHSQGEQDHELREAQQGNEVRRFRSCYIWGAIAPSLQVSRYPQKRDGLKGGTNKWD